MNYRTQWMIVCFLLAMLTSLAYIQMGEPALGIDDADIFLVYGRNIASGNGGVYSPGGERVEGFSSPLWTLIVASGFVVFDDPRFFLLLVNLFLLSAALTIVARQIEAMSGSRLSGWIFVLWALSAPGFVIWNSLTLMDTALWTSVLLVGAATVIAQPLHSRRLALIAALLVLTRPEGILWGGVFILATTIRIASQHGWRAAYAHIKLPCLAYGGVLAALTIFRLAYFGYPLPNTYYAKVSADTAYNVRQGQKYFKRFIKENRFILISVSMGLLGITAPSKDIVWATMKSALFILIGLVAPMLTGGDHFDLFRFYQPIWPLLILPVIFAYPVIEKKIRGSGYVLLACAAVAIALLFNDRWRDSVMPQRIVGEFHWAEQGRRTGNMLNTLFPDRPLIGVVTAGGIGFTYEGPIFDTMGLNSVLVAHAPGDRYGIKNHAAFNPTIFMQQHPMLFMPSSDTVDNVIRQWYGLFDVNNLILKRMLTDPAFIATYVPVLLSPPGEHALLTYIDRAYLATVQQRNIPFQVLMIPDDE
ncbi:MAG TPA: hypothetical protein VD886_24125 [Herpetosiphonaceae bacterium]|nr:hypothetical protein [Herpetosiphonaceae bacterium]